MKQTVSNWDFVQSFKQSDTYKDNFSTSGLDLLFAWFEQYEDETGQEVELDVVAICCDFNENTWQEVAEYYGVDLTECEDDDEKKEAIEEYLQYNTLFVGWVDDESCIYQVF